MSDASAERSRPSPSSSAARPAHPRTARAPLIAALILLALFAVVVTWPAEVRKLVALVAEEDSPSASIAVAPSAAPGSSVVIPLAPSAAAPAPSTEAPATPRDANERTQSRDNAERAAPRLSAAEAPSLDVESRVNALEARIAALLEQPVVTPAGLAEALAQNRRATEEAARATAQGAAEEAVKNIRGPSADVSASLAALEDRVAAVEKASVAMGSIADLEKRMAAMERASTAFAALVDLERRTGALEKTTAPLASVGDLAKRLADAERAVAPLAALSQAASRGDALTFALLALRDALDRGAAFGDVLDGLRVAAAGDDALTAGAERLAPMAQAGVPTMAALRQRLDELGRGETVAPGQRTAAESSAETADEPLGVWSEVWQRVTSSVTIRRLDGEAQASPNGPADGEAAFAAARAQLADGDLAGAVARLDDDGLRGTLDEARRASLESWLRDARGRLAAEAGFAALSRRALALYAARAASAAPVPGPSGDAAPGP